MRLSMRSIAESGKCDSKRFSDWPFRGNYISFWELRCHLGFTYTESDVYGEDYEPDRKHIKMDDFFALFRDDVEYDAVIGNKA